MNIASKVGDFHGLRPRNSMTFHSAFCIEGYCQRNSITKNTCYDFTGTSFRLTIPGDVFFGGGSWKPSSLMVNKKLGRQQLESSIMLHQFRIPEVGSLPISFRIIVFWIFFGRFFGWFSCRWNYGDISYLLPQPHEVQMACVTMQHHHPLILSSNENLK